MSFEIMIKLVFERLFCLINKKRCLTLEKNLYCQLEVVDRGDVQLNSNNLKHVLSGP